MGGRCTPMREVRGVLRQQDGIIVYDQCNDNSKTLLETKSHEVRLWLHISSIWYSVKLEISIELEIWKMSFLFFWEISVTNFFWKVIMKYRNIVSRNLWCVNKQDNCVWKVKHIIPMKLLGSYLFHMFGFKDYHQLKIHYIFSTIGQWNRIPCVYFTILASFLLHPHSDNAYFDASTLRRHWSKFQLCNNFWATSNKTNM